MKDEQDRPLGVRVRVEANPSFMCPSCTPIVDGGSGIEEWVQLGSGRSGRFKADPTLFFKITNCIFLTLYSKQSKRTNGRPGRGSRSGQGDFDLGSSISGQATSIWAGKTTPIGEGQMQTFRGRMPPRQGRRCLLGTDAADLGTTTSIFLQQAEKKEEAAGGGRRLDFSGLGRWDDGCLATMAGSLGQGLQPGIRQGRCSDGWARRAEADDGERERRSLEVEAGGGETGGRGRRSPLAGEKRFGGR
ncbi:hypothetical protein ACLOJK_013079 [Asimina triloba]